MYRVIQGIFLAFLLIGVVGCGNKLAKAPSCKGTYVRLNTPEHYPSAPNEHTK